MQLLSLLLVAAPALASFNSSSSDSSSYSTTPAPTVTPTSTHQNSTSPTPGLSTSSVLQSTIITVTDCGNKTCTPHPVTTGVTTVTDQSTIYTTYCQLPTTSSAPKQHQPLVLVPAVLSTALLLLLLAAVTRPVPLTQSPLVSLL